MSQAPDGQGFFGMGQQYAPMAAGRSFVPLTGFEGMPWGNHPMMGMMAQPFLSSFMSQSGMAPMGLHDRNVYDVMQNQRFWRMQMEMQRHVAELDRSSWTGTMRGMAAMTGTPWGAEQMRAARSMSDAMVWASPMAEMMFPGALDELAGPRGSAASMASQMSLANRYRIDPATGRMGLTPLQTQVQVEEMFSHLYGPGSSLGDMRGVSAGQLGGLYGAMSSRGMLPGSGFSSPYAQLRGMAGDRTIQNAASAAGISDLGSAGVADLDKLLNNQSVSDKMRSFDSARITNTLKGYLGVVNAMRDIFGDMGRPNAPMAELINQLDAMTNGSMAQLQPGQLSTMVRMTHQLSQATNVSLDQAMMIQMHASGRAAQLGIEPVFGVQAMQGALAWGGAYRGMGMSSIPSWGAMNADQMVQLDANLRTNASASMAAQRMGLAIRLNERTPFAAGSDAALYVSALRTADQTGANDWVDSHGQRQSLRMGEAQWTRMMTGSGVSEGTLGMMMQQQHANREFVQQYNLGGVVRAAQGRADVRPWLQQQTQAFLYGQLALAGVDATTAQKIAADKSGGIVGEIMDMDNAVFSDGKLRNAAIAKIMQDKIGNPGGKLGAKFFSNQAENFFGFWGQVQGASADFSYLGDSPVNMHRAFSERVHGQASRITQEQQLNAEIKDVLSPLNRGGMIRRAFGYLQNAGTGTNRADLPSLISTALGGVSIKDVNDKLMPVFSQVESERTEIDKLMTLYGRETDPNQRAAIRKQIDSRKATLDAYVKTAMDTVSGMGVADSMLTGSETGLAVRLHARSDTLLGQLGGGVPDWNGNNGRILAESLKGEFTSAGDVAAKALFDNVNTHRFGLEGIAHARTIRASQQTLWDMAAQYTGGSMEKLMAGDLGNIAPADRAKVAARVNAARTAMGNAVGWFDAAQKQSGASWSAESMGGGRAAEIAQRMVGTGATSAIDKLMEIEKVVKDREQAKESISDTMRANLTTATTNATKAAASLGEGVTVEDLRAGRGVLTRLEHAADEDRKAFNASPMSMAGDMFRRFGVSYGEGTGSGEAQEEALSKLLGSDVGRGLYYSLMAKRQRQLTAGRAKGLTGDDSEIASTMYNEFISDKKSFGVKYGSDALEDMEAQARLRVADVQRDPGRLISAIGDAVSGQSQKVVVGTLEGSNVTITATFNGETFTGKGNVKVSPPESAGANFATTKGDGN